MTTKHVIDGLHPSKGSFYPQDVLELSEILKGVKDERPVIVPVGGGTRLQIGAVLPRYDYALDLSKMDGLVAHNAADLTCIVQSGISLENLQNILKEEGQFLAVDTPFPEAATIGGTLASNAPGYLRWQLAHMRDMVIGMQVVLATGTITKSGGAVVKNVSGYDMARLHVGGYGTLGVISEVSFKLTPLPRKEGSVVIGFQSMDEVHCFSEKVFDSHVMPLSLVGVNVPMAENLDFDMRGSKYLTLVRLGGRDRAYDRQVSIVNGIANGHKSTFFEVIEGDICDSAWSNLRDFTGYDAKDSVSGRIFSTPSRINNLTLELLNYFTNIGSKVSAVVQPGFGTMEFHINHFPDYGEDNSLQTLDKINMIVSNNNSYVNYEKLPSPLKHGFNMWGRTNDGSQQIMASLRDTYDPARMLNRGRYISDIGMS